MASSTEGKVGLYFPWQYISSATFTTYALDTAGERYACVFRVPKTGSLRYFRFRVGTVTTSATLRVGVYTVDLATGFPTTTLIPGSSPGTVTPTSFGTWDVTLAADAAVSAGDVVALVIEFDSTTGSMLLGRYTTNMAFPYVATYTGTWAKTSGLPALIVGYADGTFPMVEGVHNPSFSSTTYGSSSTPYDEYGVTWTPDAPVRLRGVMAYLALASTATNYDVVLYQGATALATKSADGHLTSLVTGTQHLVAFDTPIDLSAGQQYRLVVKAAVSSGVQLYWSGISSLAETEAWNGSDYVMTHRVDGGAWSDEATAVPWIAPIFDRIQDGTGPDISGSYTISGVVSQAGTPVSGATVRLIRQSDNGIKSTTTNAQGQYAFSVASGHMYHAIAEWTNAGQKYNAKSLWDLTPIAP